MMYRTNAHESCSLCNNAVYGYCARCKRPMCLDHLPVRVDERCVDCEMVFDRTRLRIGKLGAIAFFAGFGLAFLPLPITGAVLVAMLTALPFAIWGLLARGRFLAQGYGNREGVLLTRQVAIAPLSAGDDVVSTGLSRARERTEMPISPIYQRTYGH
ncbi:MAG: hypothetical protein KC503_06295 [Myxococcales bacterium]|nr:hypothetical protein [Myxococcales bacterium]